MKRYLPLLLLLLLPLLGMAQAVTVPQNIYFGDIHLRISPRAQAEIQKKVDALHRSPKFFQMKVELADAYFPLIERTFKEEGVPDDFKYLALQESGLRGDAVSTSNAVGYWQFKKEAALDFNLRMDHIVDERRHIVEASRGAARYFKRSNNFYNNWFNTLLSYYHGYSGAKAYTKESDKGSKKMDITEKTDPYLITFLAHKVAYDNFVGKSAPPAVSLRELRAKPGQSLADIALAHQTDPAELEKYNKWLLGSAIPADKDYYVMLPVRHSTVQGPVASSEPTPAATPARQAAPAKAGSVIRRNNLHAIVAGKNDTKDKLAMKAGITTRKFLRYNDMRDFDKIEEGVAYYIEPKRLNADAEYHVVQHGETMQEIAQLHGIRMDYLQFKNRMKRAEVPVPGRVLWLQKRRPAKVAIEVREVKPVQPAAKTVAAVEEKEVQPKTASTAGTATEEPAASEGNVFTRFKNSLGKLKQQPATEQESRSETAPARETASAKEATAIPATKAAQEEVPVTTEKAAAIPAQKAPAQQPAKNKTETEAIPAQTSKNATLYPGKKTEATGQHGTTEQQTTAETATWGETELAGEEEVAVEELIVETKTEVATREATAAKPAPAKAASAPATTDEETDQEPLAKPARHVVKQGESLWSISRLYAVTVQDITAWNKLGNASIKVGQELIIAEPLTVPTETDAAAAPATQEEAPATPEVHTVAAGESLYLLSRKYNVTVNELKAWNNLKSTALSIGQQLRVTPPANAPASNEDLEEEPAATFSGESTQHTVVSGESLYQISRKYGVTIKDIMEWNNKSDFNVKPGDKLVIRKK